MQNRRWIGFVLSSICCFGCPGSLENPGRFPSGPLPECVGDIDVEREIFAVRCGSGECHEGDDPAEGLNLLDGNAFRHLLDVPSTKCEGRVRVDSENVRNSFLLDKLRGLSAIPPGCGDQMPFLSLLNANEIACVERWLIENIEASRDAGVSRDSGSTSGEDAGAQ